MSTSANASVSSTATPDISIPASKLLAHLEGCEQCLATVKASMINSPSCSLPASAILAHIENCTRCLRTIVECIKDGTTTQMTPASSASNSINSSSEIADPGATLVSYNALPRCLRCGDLFSPDDKEDTCLAHNPKGLLLPNYRDEYWRNNIGAAQANSPVKLTGSMYALAGYTWSCCNKSANDWGCLDVPHTISQEQIDNEREAVRGSRAIAETAKLHEAFCDLISREKGPHVCIACGAIFLDYFNTKQSCGGKNHVKTPQQPRKRVPLARYPPEPDMMSECETCGERYILQHAQPCETWHNGVRVPNFRHDVWKGKRVKKEDIGNYVDHPDYAEGFRWSKCQHHAFEEGCRFRPHINKFANLDPRPGKQMFHPGFAIRYDKNQANWTPGMDRYYSCCGRWTHIKGGCTEIDLAPEPEYATPRSPPAKLERQGQERCVIPGRKYY